MGQNFEELVLEYARFSGSMMHAVDFTKAKLQGAHLIIQFVMMVKTVVRIGNWLDIRKEVFLALIYREQILPGVYIVGSEFLRGKRK